MLTILSSRSLWSCVPYSTKPLSGLYYSGFGAWLHYNTFSQTAGPDLMSGGDINDDLTILTLDDIASSYNAACCATVTVVVDTELPNSILVAMWLTS